MSETVHRGLEERVASSTRDAVLFVLWQLGLVLALLLFAIHRLTSQDTDLVLVAGVVMFMSAGAALTILNIRWPYAPLNDWTGGIFGNRTARASLRRLGLAPWLAYLKWPALLAFLIAFASRSR